MEHGVVTQQAVVLLLSLLRFVILPNERLELRRFMIFIAALTFLISL